MSDRFRAVFRIALTQVVLSMFAGLILRYFDLIYQSDSVIAGGLLMAIDFFLLGCVWSLVFSKKYIALSVSISVFKFAILGIILYVLFGQGKPSIYHPLFFILGCSLFVLTALFEAVKSAQNASGKC